MANTPRETWTKRTVKARKNALVSICGLESIYAPVMVLENLRKEGDNIQSVCTGRDGRVLWCGSTKLTKYPDVTRKFTSFRYAPGWGFVRRLNKLSYLFSVLAETGLTAKSVKPLVRLSLQAFCLDWSHFKGLVKAILASLGTKIKVRRPSVINILRIKPRLTGAEIKSKLSGLANIPLWEYVPRY